MMESNSTAESHKRTFEEYLKRSMDLDFRGIKITTSYTFLQQFSPFKALWYRKKFKRVLDKVNQQRKENAKQGYWM